MDAMRDSFAKAAAEANRKKRKPSPSPSPSASPEPESTSDEQKMIERRTGGYSSDEAALDARREVERKKRLREYEEARSAPKESMAERAIRWAKGTTSDE